MDLGVERIIKVIPTVLVFKPLERDTGTVKKRPNCITVKKETDVEKSKQY